MLKFCYYYNINQVGILTKIHYLNFIIKKLTINAKAVSHIKIITKAYKSMEQILFASSSPFTRLPLTSSLNSFSKINIFFVCPLFLFGALTKSNKLTLKIPFSLALDPFTHSKWKIRPNWQDLKLKNRKNAKGKL